MDRNEDFAGAGQEGAKAAKNSEAEVGDGLRADLDMKTFASTRAELDKTSTAEAELSTLQITDKTSESANQKMTAEQAAHERKETGYRLQQIKKAFSQLNEEGRNQFLQIPGEGKNRYTDKHVEFFLNNHGTEAAAAMRRYIELTRTDVFR